MFETAIVALFILALLFLNGCVKNAKDVDVEGYYGRAGDVFQLVINMAADGFAWKSDGLNISYLLDTFAPPAIVIMNKGGNCSDFLRFFYEYFNSIKWNGVEDYTQHITRDGEKWHYFATFKIGGQLYLQSNMAITPAASIDAAKDTFYKEGFHYFNTFIRRW